MQAKVVKYREILAPEMPASTVGKRNLSIFYKKAKQLCDKNHNDCIYSFFALNR